MTGSQNGPFDDFQSNGSLHVPPWADYGTDSKKGSVWEMSENLLQLIFKAPRSWQE